MSDRLRDTQGRLIRAGKEELYKKRLATNLSDSAALKSKKVRITGVEDIIKNLRQLNRRYPERMQKAMTQIVTAVQNTSMRYTPVDTGNLRGSHRGKVEKVFGRVRGVVYLLASYALFVHEAPETTKFKSHWPAGRKFLERAVVDNSGKIKEKIKQWM